MASMSPRSLAFCATLALAACGGESPSTSAAKPAASAVALTAPAGAYTLDPNHASLLGKVQHMNLAPYHVRFTKFDVKVNLDPANLSASSVEVTIDPTSVRTDYTGDYKGTHPDSPFASFEEALAQGPKFFNAGQFATVTFKSTKVEPQGEGRMKVTGDLTLLGQTHPVTLDATLTGAMAEHPFTKVGAMGFSATGTFKRSQFGMDIGVGKFLGDDVTVQFDGEFKQQVASPPA
jgi:polyisoprenoid-binding protein YceI